MPSLPSTSFMPSATAITVNINGASFQIWDETRRMRFSGFGSQTQQAVWTFYCKWTDSIAIGQALLGGSKNLAGTTLYANGWQYPDNQAWYCQSADITPDDGLRQPGTNSATLVDFAMAKVVATFGIPNYGLSLAGMNLGEVAIDFCSISIPLPGRYTTMQYVPSSGSPAPVPAEMQPSIEIPSARVSQAAFNVPRLPSLTIATCLKKTNSEVMYGFAPGTLRYEGAESQRNLTSSGLTNVNITHNFAGNYFGWNNLPWGSPSNTTGYSFTPVQWVIPPFAGWDASNAPYPQVDLTQLFSITAQ